MRRIYKSFGSSSSAGTWFSEKQLGIFAINPQADLGESYFSWRNQLLPNI